MDRKKSAAEVWIDDHREFLLLALIIPIGKIVSVVESIIAGFTYPDPADHQLRVERIRADVEHNYSTKTGEMLRTDRKSQSSLNVRVSDKTAAKKIAIRGLRSILEVNTNSMTVTVEPFVTIGDLVKFLDKRGYELTTAIEMKKATIGGLVLALGMTTSSHKHGLMSDIVQSYEIVSAEGK
ncbi:MAG TPA: FAD-binding protein, partial [Treponemataceae bacterium]|nr:FAD-binding protein [Treponemataceae bacterium]